MIKILHKIQFVIIATLAGFFCIGLGFDFVAQTSGVWLMCVGMGLVFIGIIISDEQEKESVKEVEELLTRSDALLPPASAPSSSRDSTKTTETSHENL